MEKKKIKKEAINEIYFCFEESDETLKDVLQASFLDYLDLNEKSKPFANMLEE